MLFCTVLFLLFGDYVSGSLKQKYISSAFLLMVATVAVKIISALYKIPLTSYIGAVGRGYFSTAYNLCLPIHALTMGAFPIALTKLVSSYEAKGNTAMVKAVRAASKKLFFIIGLSGMIIMLIAARPYSHIVSDSNNAVYTIAALAPSVFFSCLCACNRAFCEGYMDMKCTSISQIIEAIIKTLFGLLFARISMSLLINEYLNSASVLGIVLKSEEEALHTIYPITSASAMLGATLGSIISYIFSLIYVNCKHNLKKADKEYKREALNELVAISLGLVGATAVQSVSSFFDNFSVQYCLSSYNTSVLENIFNSGSSSVSTYAYGVYSAVLDFKNLIPSIVMSLGVAAVPAVSSSFESSDQRFSNLMTSIFKYSTIISVTGGAFLALFCKDVLDIFYSSNPDISANGFRLLYYSGITILPCCIASTAVYCSQALGYSKKTIIPFAVSAVIRVILNFLLIPISSINLVGALISNFIGYTVIALWNFLIIIKNTHCKLNFFDVLIKPLCASTLTFFVVKTVINGYLSSIPGMVGLCLSVLFFVVIHIFNLFFLKCISLKDIKIHK